MYNYQYKKDNEWRRRKIYIYILLAIYAFLVIVGFVYNWGDAFAEEVYFVIISIVIADAILLLLIRKREPLGEKPKKSLRDLIKSTKK